MSVINRYKCNLSSEVLEKAVKELNEPVNNDERLQKIDELRTAFYNQDHGLTLVSDDDAFILRFLRARKFNHERALKILINYHTQRKSWPEVFEKVKNPTLVKHVFEAGCFVRFNGDAIDGSGVCIGRPGKIEKPLMTEFVAALTLTIEHLLTDEKYQVYGVTVIEDMSYLGFEMMQQMGPVVGKRFINWLQDAMPVRVKSVNIVNESTIFDMLFAVVRPFMKEKLKKRLKVHGNVFATLHEVVSPASLPPLYGGTGSDLDEDVVDSWKNDVYEDFGQDTRL